MRSIRPTVVHAVPNCSLGFRLNTPVDACSRISGCTGRVDHRRRRPRVAVKPVFAIAWLLSNCTGISARVPTDAFGLETGTDAGSPSDTTSVGDAAFIECVTADDCEGAISAGGGCQTAAWSCVLGRCTAQCSGGQNCSQDTIACVKCSRQSMPDERSCVADACTPAALPARLISASCRRPVQGQIAGCFGSFVRLTDGTLCTVETLSDGETQMLACGRCQFVFGN